MFAQVDISKAAMTKKTGKPIVAELLTNKVRHAVTFLRMYDNNRSLFSVLIVGEHFSAVKGSPSRFSLPFG
jgi:hypothetical protein